MSWPGAQNRSGRRVISPPKKVFYFTHTRPTKLEKETRLDGREMAHD
jgi:hypothetical protein